MPGRSMGRGQTESNLLVLQVGDSTRVSVSVKSNLAEAKQQGIEQVGSWDPFPNKIYGEQLVALNLDRISYWLARGAEPSTRVAELLGIAGVLPVHPRSYLVAHRARSATAAYTEEQKATIAPAPTTEDAETEQNTGDQPPEPNPISRPDSVWRRGREPPWWWFTGLT
ncbi:unnamed protein product [Echinostoma caproni]|uniref:Small ribosomal subunit protein bS16m n=1 Tax=Echinostoma caproni TaxID=27848 RepID=A0A183B0G3_9TREM|nr:unnamed protein product [Echinostoma caproni]